MPGKAEARLLMSFAVAKFLSGKEDPNKKAGHLAPLN
jgi:hypothetical protein